MSGTRIDRVRTRSTPALFFKAAHSRWISKSRSAFMAKPMPPTIPKTCGALAPRGSGDALDAAGGDQCNAPVLEKRQTDVKSRGSTLVLLNPQTVQPWGLAPSEQDSSTAPTASDLFRTPSVPSIFHGTKQSSRAPQSPRPPLSGSAFASDALPRSQSMSSSQSRSRWNAFSPRVAPVVATGPPRRDARPHPAMPWVPEP